MFFLPTQASIDAAYAECMGLYHYASFAQHQVTRTALSQAQLQDGESVLEVGAGSGAGIAEAKNLVGAGHCVAVDAVQGFIDTDIPFALRNKQLSVAPNGGPSTQVHWVCSNITHSDFASTITHPPGKKEFDCILAPASSSTCPLGHQGEDVHNPRRVPLANGDETFLKSLMGVTQTGPNRLWVTAATQALGAVEAASFVVRKVTPIGKGNDLGLAAGLSSPPMSQPMSMGYPKFQNATDLDIVRAVQQFIQEDRHAMSKQFMPTNVVHMSIEACQVGVMMVLAKM